MTIYAAQSRTWFSNTYVSRSGLLIFIADLESLPIKNKIDDFSTSKVFRYFRFDLKRKRYSRHIVI